MDFGKIIAISGKPGLYRQIAQAKHGMIVESVTDGKRFTAFIHDRLSTLEEISVFMKGDDLPLKEVLKKLQAHLEGKPAIHAKSDPKELRAFLGEVLPEFDRERVHDSDIRKIITWYNLLLEKDMLNFEETPETKEKDAEKPNEEQKESTE